VTPRPHLLLGALALLPCPGCLETVELAGLDPRLLLQQDWDRDGIPEALPEDGEGLADYAIDFGEVVVRRSADRLLLLRNRDGDRPALRIQSLRLEPEASGFFFDPPPRAELPAGQATFVSLYFSPGERRAAEAVLSIESNDPLHSRRTVRLRGRGVTPDVVVCLLGDEGDLCHDEAAPRNLRIDFGLREPGERASQDFEVRNRGDTTLSVRSGGGRGGVDLSFGASLEFSLDPRAWSGELLPGERRRFSAFYAPLDGGPDSARVEIVSSDPDQGLLAIDVQGSGLAPKICPQPPYEVDFGTLLTADRAEKSYRLASCGSLPLLLEGLDIEDDVAGVFSLPQRPSLPLSLLPGQALNLPIAFFPRQSGVFSGRLHVRTNAEEGFIALQGKGRADAACELVALPPTLDFGQVSTSGFSTKPLTLRNQGTKECQVTGMTGPTGSAAFTVPNPPGFPMIIPIGEQRDVLVKFAPGSEGDAQATLQFTEAETGGAQATLKGRGITPPPCDFQADPAALNFGSVPQGTSKTLKTKIYNFGSETCQLWQVELAPGSDPSFLPKGIPFPMMPEVDPGDFYEQEVTLTPQHPGVMTGTMLVRGGEDPMHLVTIQVALSGGAEAASICVSPQVLDFGPVGVGQTKDMGITVTSCGSGTLRVRGVMFEGNNADFTWASAPGAPFSLPGGQSRTLMVRYSPSDGGSDFGRVVISSSDSANPEVVVGLRGNYSGTCPAVLECRPSSLTFAATDIGQSSDMGFACTNHGTESLRVVSVGPGAGTSSEFRVGVVGVPRDLGPGEELRVEVSYLPVDVGRDVGSVVVQSQFSSSGCDNFTLVSVSLDAEGKTPNYPECITPRQFNPVLKFAWPNGNVTAPSFRQVFMTPIVINLTDDNRDGFINEEDIPDIVFTAYETMQMNRVWQPAILRAISGDDGHEIWTWPRNPSADPTRLNYETQVAAADIDGDNLPEILASKLVITDSGEVTGQYVTGNILAFEHDGTFKWESEPWHGSEDDIEDGSGIGVADLDHDGHPEIWRSSSVFDHRGKIKWEGTAGRGTAGHGAFCTAADLDQTGGMELICGNTAYHADGTIMWRVNKADGFASVADFNLDGKPEVFLAAMAGLNGGMFILNGQTGAILSSLPSNVDASAIIPATIANLDGSGGPEIGVVGTCQLSSPNPDGETDGECFYGFDVNESNFAITRLWREEIYDTTLGAGNTSFDFEGDGPFEMLQNDERWVNIYSGLAHTLIYHAERISVTGWELPVVADVNNDGHAEIVVKQDSHLIPVDKGILVYGNIDNDWVATRRIWNQFDYHITNVRENGTIPRFEIPNWTVYNNQLANEPFCK